MLNIFFGEMKEAIYNTSTYFNNQYLDSWITEDFTRSMIRAVDRSEVISGQAVESKALGVIPVTKLSGGVKTLILIDHEPEKIFNASTCGDNCAKWLLKIASRHDHDITINLHHLMDFNAGKKNNQFEIRILNTGEIVHNMAEYAMAAVTPLREGERQ